jgi:UDP-N-acetylglucosamine 2-epimerase (non-hydrolysing)
MKRVSFIFGTRPEAIKLCPLVLRMQDHPTLRPHVCITAQHREMLDQVLEVFGVAPDVDLALMQPNQTLAGLTARAITAIDGYLAEHRPDLVLVQGDTTTVLCATLSAFYQHIPVGHVEAGLRTGNMDAPWPEEANRVLTSHLAALHFAPTETSRANLRREGIADERIFVTGNTVIDALFLARERVERRPPAVPGLPPQVLTGPRRLVLITGHRRENFGPGLAAICRAIGTLAERFPDVEFVYPVHLNPNVRAPVFGALNGRANVHLIEPLDYLAFEALMARATLLLSDSGGVQEEAPALGKPVLVLRDTTERPEAVEAGTVRLVGTDAARIVAETARLLTDPAAHAAMATRRNPYGDGHAAERILAACAEFLGVAA